MTSHGYSGTPLPRKLGIKPGHTVRHVNAPSGFETAIATEGADISEAVATTPGTDGPDVVIYFTTERIALARDIESLGAAIRPSGALWIAWPKRASGVDTDLTEDTLREVILPLGLVDNKVCAIDSTWSGLRFVWRRSKRGPRAEGGEDR